MVAITVRIGLFIAIIGLRIIRRWPSTLVCPPNSLGQVVANTW